MKERLLVLLILLVGFHQAFCQNVFSDLRSLSKRADYYYSKLAYVKAADLYTQALKKKKNKSDYELNKKAAALYRVLARYEEARLCFTNIIQSGHRLNSQDSLDYFNVLRAVGDLKADTIFTNLFSRTILNNLFRDTLYYNIYSIPINSIRSDYCPVTLTKGLMYVSEEEDSSIVKKVNGLNNAGFSGLYYSIMSDTGWSNGIPILPAMENILHAGPVIFYNDNRNAIINLCLEEGNTPFRLKLYSADFDEEKKLWSNLASLPINSNSYSLAHPAISPDGLRLVFVSDKEGGYGGTDIYESRFINGSWSSPKNLGGMINTKGNEKYPYITSDNVLFFSTDGRYGMGGLDIYYVDLNFRDSVVVNMGYPVNSNLDDFGFSYDRKTKTGYFSSNRNSNGKEDDIYQYTENKIFLTITLKDDFDKTHLEDVNVRVWDSELNIPIRSWAGEESDKVNVWLRPAHKYKIIIQKEDFRSDTFAVSTYGIEDYSKTINKVIYLKRKPVYYAVLKLKNEGISENLAGAIIIVNNLTRQVKDTIAHEGASLKIKLDGECEYIISAKNGDRIRYIYVEKKSFRIASSFPYYNLYLASVKPSILHVRVQKCEDGSLLASPEVTMKVNDWVNGNQFRITPGPDGDFQVVVTDARLFDLFVSGTKISYTSQKVKTEGYCITFIDHK